MAKGYGNGESQAWVGSQVGSLDSRTTIESGGDANIIGSQVKGKSVKVSAEKLNIHSLQDTMKYEGKQESASGQVTVGYGVSGSASYSKSKMSADMATVNQQAGIFAWDEGYDIHIANHSDLKGGLVTSTAQAENEGRNQFSTGTLSYSHIENHADYKGSAVGVSAAGDYKGGWNGQKVGKEGNPTHSLSNAIGYGKDQDSQAGTTYSGINTQNLIIRDEQGQLEKTGKNIEQIKEDIKTDITTETAESRSGKLENRFDKDKLQKELDYQVKAITDFQAITMATINEKVASHAESKRAEAEQAKAAGNTTKARELEQEAEKWETGGAYRQGVDAVTNAVGLALGGSPTAGVIAGAVSPYINTGIKQATEGNTEANLIAHAIWGAVEAYTQGGKAGAGAAAAVTGEVGANIISQSLFGKEPKNLTEAEKKTVSELSQVAAGLAGGLSASGGNSLSTAQAMKTGQGIGKNAVENNAVNKNDAGDIATLLNMLNNSPSKVGLLKGEEASQKLLDFNNTGDISELYTPNQVAYFNIQKGRYIYTEKGGWIDMVHFLFYAGEAYEEKLKLQKEGLSLKESQDRAYVKSIFLGWKQENVFDAWFARHSSFSYEDLPSDRYGAEFGSKYFDKNSELSLGEQILNYLHSLKPAKPEDAPNYRDLPYKDNGKHPGIYNRTTKPIYTKEVHND